MSNYDLKLTPRETNLALYELSFNNIHIIVPNDLDYLKKSCKSIQLNDSAIDSLILKIKSNIIPEDSVSWLTNDLRALVWFSAFLKLCQPSIPVESARNFYIDFEKNFITAFDCFSFELTENVGMGKYYHLDMKLRLVRMALTTYSSFKTKPRELDWLNESDEQQIMWAREYLENINLLLQPSLFYAINSSQAFAQVCASIDFLDFLANGQPPVISQVATSQPHPHSHPQQQQQQQQPDNQLQAMQPDPRIETNIADYPHQQFGNHEKMLIDMRAQQWNEQWQALWNTNTNQNTIHGQQVNRYIPKADTEPSLFKKDILRKMRNAWSQKKFRDKMDTDTAQEVLLGKRYTKKLDRLASTNKIDSISYLKLLIDAADENL